MEKSGGETSKDGWDSRPKRKKQEIYQEEKWRWETTNPNKRKPVKVVLPDAMTPTPPSHEQLDMFSRGEEVS